MADPKTELVAAWVRAAQDDLGSAVKLVEGETIYPGTALYHCQQCAEKSLKAYLLLKDIEFEKTHRACARTNRKRFLISSSAIAGGRHEREFLVC